MPTEINSELNTCRYRYRVILKINIVVVIILCTNVFVSCIPLLLQIFMYFWKI